MKRENEEEIAEEGKIEAEGGDQSERADQMIINKQLYRVYRL